MIESSKNDLNLLDFGIIGEELSISELLHSSYVRGKEDFQKEIETDFQKNLQSAAHYSSLLKSKLIESGISVKDMYLKFLKFNTFQSLVVLDSKDFYDKTKRWDAYKIAETINNTNSRIDLTFSFMSHSDDLMVENIASDGFIFRYGSK